MNFKQFCCLESNCGLGWLQASIPNGFFPISLDQSPHLFNSIFVFVFQVLYLLRLGFIPEPVIFLYLNKFQASRVARVEVTMNHGLSSNELIVLQTDGQAWVSGECSSLFRDCWVKHVLLDSDFLVLVPSKEHCSSSPVDIEYICEFVASDLYSGILQVDRSSVLVWVYVPECVIHYWVILFSQASASDELKCIGVPNPLKRIIDNLICLLIFYLSHSPCLGGNLYCLQLVHCE